MRARVNVVESNADGGMFRAANPPISYISFVTDDFNTLNIRVEFAINGNRYRNEGGKAFLEIRRPYAQPNSQSGVDFQTVAGYEKSIRDLGSSQSVKIIDLSSNIGNPTPGPYRYAGIGIEKTDERLPSNNPDDIIMSTEFLRDCVYRYAVDPAALSCQGVFVDRTNNRYLVTPPTKKFGGTIVRDPDEFDAHYRSSTYEYEKIETRVESDYFRCQTDLIRLTYAEFSTASVYEFSYQNPDNGSLELLEIDISDSIPRIQEMLLIDSEDPNVSYELYLKGFTSYGSLTDYQNSQQLFDTYDNIDLLNRAASSTSHLYRISTIRNEKYVKDEVKSYSAVRNVVLSGFINPDFYVDERRKVIIVKNLPHKANFVRAIATHRNGVIELGSSQITSGISTVEISIATVGLIDRKTYEVSLEFEIEFNQIRKTREISWRYFKFPPRDVSISVENLGLGRITRTNNPDELLNDDIRNRFKVTTSFLSSKNDSTAANVILQSAAISETIIPPDKKEYSDILTFRVKTRSFSSVSPEEIMPERSGSTSDGFVNWDDVNFTTSDRLYGKVYNFSLGMRDPNALQTNQSGYKWGKAGGFQRASLPSNLKTDRSSSTLVPFEEVEAGAIFTIFEEGNIALTNPPSIVQLSVSIIPSFNQIEWSFQGAADTTFLDHVQVYGTYAGTEKLLGTSFRTNFYRDKLLWNLPGDVTYRVVPVYNDYTFGDSRGITFRSMESTLPRIVMSDFANGEDARYFKPIASASFPPPNIDQEDLLSLDVTGQSTQTERSFTPVFETLSIEEASQAVQSGPDPGRTSESKKGATKKFRIGTPKPVSDIIKSGAPSLKDILSRETRIASDIAEPLGPGRRFRR